MIAVIDLSCEESSPEKDVAVRYILSVFRLFFFDHLEQNSGRDKTQVLGETQVFLPKTQLFFSQKLRFPKL